MLIRKPNQAEQKLKQQIWRQAEADRSQLLLRQPFIGSLIMRMDLVTVCDSRLQTAATDGSNIFLDCHFYSKLDSEERLFLLAHEVWHCVFLHFIRRQNRSRKRWNVAADLEIQFILKKEKMKNPAPLPYPKGWENLNAEEIYRKLEQIPAAEQKQFGDVHLEKNDSPDDMGKKPAKAKTTSKGTHAQNQPKPPSQESGDLPQNGKGDLPGTATEESVDATADDDNAFVIDPEYAPFFVSEIVERTRTRVISAARQLERMRGTMPGSLQKLLDTMLDSKLPWQELLAQFVTTYYGGKRRWLPPSRRHVARGLYLPSIREQKLKAVVAIDTSGSTRKFLPQFFTELNSLLTSFGDYELTVIQCDTRIHDVKQYSNFEPVPANHRWQAKGYGGTDFRPVFKYLDKHPEIDHSLLIFFTDGYGPAPLEPPPYPVLWLISEKGQVPAPWGTVIQL